MDIKEFYKGCRVYFNDVPGSAGKIVELSLSRALVSWDNGNTTWEVVSDLEPIPTAKQKVGNLIAHWNVKENVKDLAAVRSIVESAIADCGLDATAKVDYDTNHDIPTLGHLPYRAVIKVNDTYPAVRMRNGTLVKGLDTITVVFSRQVGLYDYDAYGERKKVEAGLFANKGTAAAMAAIDALPWDGEVVEFSARTNGMARGYRKRNWYPFEGGIPGYGASHIGGHFDYSDTWENLKVSFAAYLGKVAADLGYAGKVARVEAA